MKILGIDPGKNGAWCLLDTINETAEAGKLEWTIDGILNFEHMPPGWDHVVIEKVRAIPGKMGASSAFTFGMGYGQIVFAFGIYPTTFVSPRTWQAHCLEGIDTDLNVKLRSRYGFARLNPEYKKAKLDDNIADAFHLAHYGVNKLGLTRGRWKWLKSPVTSKQSKK